MRVSTSMQYLQNKVSLIEGQTDLNKTIESVASGKRVRIAGDDPIAMVDINYLNQYNKLLDQYQSNIQDARYRMNVAESTIASMQDVVSRARELIIQGGDAANDQYAQDSIANELSSLYDTLIDALNVKDESNNFVFAGYQTDKRPFSKSNVDGLMVYNGDDGHRFSYIDEEMTTITNISGAELMVDVSNPLGDLRVNYLEHSEGNSYVSSAMRNPRLAEDVPLSLQDEYAFTFGQASGVDLNWQGPMVLDQNYTVIMRDEHNHELRVDIPKDTNLDPTAENGTALASFFKAAVKAQHNVGYEYFNVEGEANRLLLKSTNQESDMTVLVQPETAYPNDFNVELTDINYPNNVLDLDRSSQQITKSFSNMITDYHVSNNFIDALEVRFSFTLANSTVQDIYVSMDSNIRSAQDAADFIAISMTQQLDSILGLNDVKVRSHNQEFIIDDPSDQIQSLALGSQANPAESTTNDFGFTLVSANGTQEYALSMKQDRMGGAGLPLFNISRDPQHIRLEPGDERGAATDISVKVDGEDPVYDLGITAFEMNYSLESNEIEVFNGDYVTFEPLKFKVNNIEGDARASTIDFTGAVTLMIESTSLEDSTSRPSTAIEIPITVTAGTQLTAESFAKQIQTALQQDEVNKQALADIGIVGLSTSSSTALGVSDVFIELYYQPANDESSAFMKVPSVTFANSVDNPLDSTEIDFEIESLNNHPQALNVETTTGWSTTYDFTAIAGTTSLTGGGLNIRLNSGTFDLNIPDLLDVIGNTAGGDKGADDADYVTLVNAISNAFDASGAETAGYRLKTNGNSFTLSTVVAGLGGPTWTATSTGDTDTLRFNIDGQDNNLDPLIPLNNIYNPNAITAGDPVSIAVVDIATPKEVSSTSENNSVFDVAATDPATPIQVAFDPFNEHAFEYKTMVLNCDITTVAATGEAGVLRIDIGEPITPLEITINATLANGDNLATAIATKLNGMTSPKLDELGLTVEVDAIATSQLNLTYRTSQDTYENEKRDFAVPQLRMTYENTAEATSGTNTLDFTLAQTFSSKTVDVLAVTDSAQTASTPTMFELSVPVNPPAPVFYDDITFSLDDFVIETGESELTMNITLEGVGTASATISLDDTIVNEAALVSAIETQLNEGAGMMDLAALGLVYESQGSDLVFSYLPDILVPNVVSELPPNPPSITFSYVDSGSALTTPNPSTISFVLNSDGAEVLEVRDAIQVGVPTTVNFEKSPPAAQNSFTMMYQITPKAGDVMAMSLKEETQVNLLDAMQGVINLLEAGDSRDSGYHVLNYGRFLEEFDAGRVNLTTKRADLGTRLNQLDLIESYHVELKYVNTVMVSPLEDLDYAVAMSEFTQQEVALKALSSLFAKVMGVSLFDYI